MLLTLTNISDKTLRLSNPITVSSFTVGTWDNLILLPGELAVAEITLDPDTGYYAGGSLQFSHNLHPSSFTIATTVQVIDLIVVRDASDSYSILNGDVSPNVADGTDFEDLLEITTNEFILRNIGLLPITGISVSVPSGYTLEAAPDASLDVGEQTSFIIRCDANIAGANTGLVHISSDGYDDYVFEITAYVVPYHERRTTNLIQYFRMIETAGTLANDTSSENNDGAYIDVALDAEPSPISDETMPEFSANGLVNLYSAGLVADFDPALGTVVLWLKVLDISIWSDGAYHWLLRLYADNDNYIDIFKNTTPHNQLIFIYKAGGTAVQATVTITPTAGNMCIAMTWDTALDRMRAFVDGVQQGSDHSGLGIWVGDITPFTSCLGAAVSDGTFGWEGYLAQYRLYNIEETELVLLAEAF